MSDKNKKTPLEEAVLNFAEIQKFAEEQAAAQLKEQVSEKIKEIFEDKLNEEITITISNDGENVEVAKDGDAMSSIGGDSTNGIEGMEGGSEEMGLGLSDLEDDSEEFIVSDEDDEISIDENGNDFEYEKNGVKYGKNYLPEIPDEINLNTEETIQNQNMEEMNKITMEDAAAPAPALPAAPAADAAPVADAAAVAPVDGVAAPEEAMPELLSKLDTLINVLLQQQGAAPEDGAATAGEEGEFEVIDDEAGAVAPAAAAPMAPAPAAPMQEEEIEIVDFDGGNKEHENFIDEMEGEMLEIVDEDEVPMEGMSMEETRGLSFTSKRTGDKTLKMDTMKDEKGHHAPVTSLKENKAQQESKADELIKENNGLKNTVKELQKDKKDFEEAFIELRKQFNEMQTFNGKLALVNRVLMNGGLTTEEKVRICEQFDQASTFDEANKLFKTIMKESTNKVAANTVDKLKGAATNTAKPRSTSEPLYESTEAKRLKRLAGIGKSEDEN